MHISTKTHFLPPPFTASLELRPSPAPTRFPPPRRTATASDLSRFAASRATTQVSSSSHARRYCQATSPHELSSSTPSARTSTPRPSSNVHQARPKCCPGTSVTTISRPAPISCAGPPTSLGQPQTSPNWSEPTRTQVVKFHRKTLIVRCFNFRAAVVPVQVTST